MDSLSGSRFMVVVNKSDIVDDLESWFPESISEDVPVVRVSAKTGAGISEFRKELIQLFSAEDISGVGFLLTDARHFDLLTRARDGLKEADSLCRSLSSEELILVGLYNALGFLGEITGETTVDDVLAEIFSTFCIGK